MMISPSFSINYLLIFLLHPVVHLSRKKTGNDSTRGDAIRLVYDPKQNGWLYRINRKESATLQKQLPNITIKVTKKEGIFFLTTRLADLNDEKYSMLSSTYNDASKEVIDDVLNIASSYCDSLSQLAELVKRWRSS